MAGDGVSCLSLDPAKTVICLAGTVSKAAAADVFGSIAHDFATAADSTINWLWAQMSDATAIRLGGTAFNQLLAVAGLVAIVIAVGIFAIQMAISAVRRDPSGISRAAGGLVVMGLGGGAAIAVTELLLQAVDAISAGVLQVTTGDSMQQMGNSILAAGAISAATSNPAALILISLLALAAVVMVWLALTVRKLLVIVAAVLSPFRVRRQSRRFLPIVGAPMGRTGRRFGVLEADPHVRLHHRTLRPPQGSRQYRDGRDPTNHPDRFGGFDLGVGRVCPLGGDQNGPLRWGPVGGDAHDGRACDGRCKRGPVDGPPRRCRGDARRYGGRGGCGRIVGHEALVSTGIRQHVERHGILVGGRKAAQSNLGTEQAASETTPSTNGSPSPNGSPHKPDTTAASSPAPTTSTADAEASSSEPPQTAREFFWQRNQDAARNATPGWDPPMNPPIRPLQSRPSTTKGNPPKGNPVP